jgi:hypothetical protein
VQEEREKEKLKKGKKEYPRTNTQHLISKVRKRKTLL